VQGDKRQDSMPAWYILLTRCAPAVPITPASSDALASWPEASADLERTGRLDYRERTALNVPVTLTRHATIFQPNALPPSTPRVSELV